MNVSVSVGLIAATCTLAGVVVGIFLAGWYVMRNRW